MKFRCLAVCRRSSCARAGSGEALKRIGSRLCCSLMGLALGCHTAEPLDLGPGGPFASNDSQTTEGAMAGAGIRSSDAGESRPWAFASQLPPHLVVQDSTTPRVQESSPSLLPDEGRAQSLGTPCRGASECADGFCVDGVCCESACDGACQECAPSGLCDRVPVHDPACGELICPNDDMICRTHVSLLVGNCGGLGRCAGPEDCAVVDAPRGTACGDNLSCDGWGSCVPNEPDIDTGPAAECQVTAGFDDSVVDCSNSVTEHLLARGSGKRAAFQYLQVEVSEWILELGMFGFDANDVYIEPCTLIESAPGTYVTPRGACDGAVRWVLYSNE